jgi:hypothetical protein
MRRLAVASAVPGSVVAARWMAIVFLRTGFVSPGGRGRWTTVCSSKTSLPFSTRIRRLVAPDGERIYYLRNSMDILKDQAPRQPVDDRQRWPRSSAADHRSAQHLLAGAVTGWQSHCLCRPG